MARQYAQIKVSIWSADDSFRHLTPAAQHLYFVLLTQASLSLAGVLDWRPKRIARLAKGWSVEAVMAAAGELVTTGYIVTDDQTEEILIRSFVKNDGVMKNPKIAAGMVSAWTEVYSTRLRGCIAEQVRRASDDLSEAALKVVRMVTDYQSDWVSEDASDWVSDDLPEDRTDWVPDPPATFNLQPATNNQQPVTVIDEPPTAPSKAIIKPQRFDAWWAAYPKKVGKEAGRTAYVKAMKIGAIEDDLIAAAHAYAQATADTPRKFVCNPSTWLHQGRWADDMTTYAERHRGDDGTDRNAFIIAHAFDDYPQSDLKELES